MTPIRFRNVAIFLAAAMLLAACCAPARAEDGRPGPGPGDGAPEAARGLVEEVLRKAGSGGDDGLGEWTRATIERALERAGRDAEHAAGAAAGTSPAPLAAERHAARTAAGLAGRANSADIIVFTSLSVPGPELAAMERREASADRRAAGAARRRGRGNAGNGATNRRPARRRGGGGRHRSPAVPAVRRDPRAGRGRGPGRGTRMHQPGLLGRRGSAPRRDRREHRSRRRIGGDRRRGRPRPGTSRGAESRPPQG